MTDLYKTVADCSTGQVQQVVLTDDEIAEQQTQEALFLIQQQALAVTNFISTVKAALDESDKTMSRVQEAVSLGLTTLTAPDVILWVNYRRSLRDLLASSSVEALPIKPAYPAGT